MKKLFIKPNQKKTIHHENSSVEVKKSALLLALSSIKPGITTKGQSDGMSYFFFTGDRVISFNNSISISYPIVTGFSGFIKADALYNVVTKAKNETFTFSRADNKLQMKAGKVELDFMSKTDNNVSSRVSVVSESFKSSEKKPLPDNFIECVSLCSHIASNEEDKQTLTCIHIDGNEITSTDNKRIAIASMSSPMDKMLLKAKEMKALIAIKPLYYHPTKSWIHFSNDQGCVFSILDVKGEYPNMRQFMEFDGVCVSLPESILEGIDIASIFTDSIDPMITISIANGVCKIYKKSDMGNVNFEDSIDYSGEDISFYINHAMLQEMMIHSTKLIIDGTKARLVNENFSMVTALGRM
jgi:hypothetical protein